MTLALLAVAGLATGTRSATGVALSVLLLIYLAVVVVSIIAAVKVVTKAGYSGWWVLTAVVPILNFVMLLVFAFAEWPVVREVKMLRNQASGWQGYGRPGFGGGAAGLGGSSYPPGPTFPNDRQESGGPLPPFDTIVPPRPQADDQPATTDDGGAADAAGPDHGVQQRAQAPPGWYPTPDGRVRYWDGSSWTDHFA